MNATLITGADGHIGSAVSRWLLANTERRLVLAVRAAGPDELEYKRRLLPADPRCRVVAVDLRDRSPFDGLDLREIEAILHCAALTEFTVSRQDAAAVNVAGTTRVIEAARRCPRLVRFGYVSSIYAAGLACGELAESPWPAAREFANHYEWSKWSAEQAVIADSGLPWQVFRISTVLADDGSGRIGQRNVIHNTFRLLFYGLLPVVPGDPGTRVYTVTTEFAAAGIGTLMCAAPEHGVFHLSESGASAPTLAEVTDAAFGAFLDDADFERAAILKPRFCDRDAFERLATSAAQFGTALAQSLGSVAPFVPQLYTDKAVSTAHTVDALGGRQPPRGRDLVAVVARRLAESRWGLRPESSMPGVSHDR